MATTIGVGVAIIAIVVSLVMTLRSERLTRDGQLLERQQADAAAARTEAAAALTEEYTRRVVEALESMAPSGNALTTQQLPRGVKWSLTHHDGDAYMLKNLGDATAYKVTVSTDESLEIFSPEVQDVEPDSGVSFIAAPSMATRDYTVTVRWRDDPLDFEPDHTWKYPLPPRPRRAKAMGF